MEVKDTEWTLEKFGIRYKWTETSVLCQRWNGIEYVDLTSDERLKYGFPPATLDEQAKEVFFPAT